MVQLWLGSLSFRSWWYKLLYLHTNDSEVTTSEDKVILIDLVKMQTH